MRAHWRASFVENRFSTTLPMVKSPMNGFGADGELSMEGSFSHPRSQMQEKLNRRASRIVDVCRARKVFPERFEVQVPTRYVSGVLTARRALRHCLTTPGTGQKGNITLHQDDRFIGYLTRGA